MELSRAGRTVTEWAAFAPRAIATNRMAANANLSGACPKCLPLFFQNGVKKLFERRIAAAASGHYLLRPIQVITFAAATASQQAAVSEMSARLQILSAILICLAPADKCGACSICNRLRSCLGRLLSSVTSCTNNANRLPELLVQLLGRRRRVLDRVVENGRLKYRQVGNSTDAGQDLRHGDRMVDVRRGVGIFASLAAVLLGGKPQGGEERGCCVVRGRGRQVAVSKSDVRNAAHSTIEVQQDFILFSQLPRTPSIGR